MFLALACRGAERQPCHECRDESVAAERQRDDIRPERQRKHGDLTGQLGGQLPSVGRNEKEAADSPDHDSCDDGDRDLLDRVGEMDALRAAGGCRERDEENDERRRDAIVEPAFDVEDAPDPDRDGRVRHDGQAQGSVRRREDRPDEQRGRHWQFGKDEPGDEPAGRDRQQEPDPEESTDQTGVAAESVHVDGRGVGEQDEGKGQLGKLPDRRRLDVDVEHAQDVRSEQQPGQDEEHRRTDRRLVESVGDERVARQKQDEQRDPGFRWPPPTPLARPTLGTLSPTVTAVTLARHVVARRSSIAVVASAELAPK